MIPAHGAAISTIPLRIAVAKPGDLSGIMELEHRCFSSADRFARSTWRHLLGTAASNGTSVTLVAHAAGEIVGKINALLRTNSRVVRIYSIGTDPSQRGRGLARALMLALLRRIDRRCDVVSLEVRSANAGARRLYEGLGMQINAQLPGHYPDGGDGMRYRASRAALLTVLRASGAARG
jgi:ribosomal protein S18 acetylase RimI-like enzyme